LRGKDAARENERAGPGALDGLRVVDLTRILAGPLCTMMLGDLARGDQDEPPGAGDDTRAWGPTFVAGEAAYFLGITATSARSPQHGIGAGQAILATS